jgi:hypothetical protein
MRTWMLIICLLLASCGSPDYSSDNCAGVDTSQQPNRRTRIVTSDGHYCDTLYWDNFCSITYCY